MMLFRHRLGFFLLLVAVISGFGCAYYNTFFLARQKFNQAEKNQEENFRNRQRQEESTAPPPGGQVKPGVPPQARPQQGGSSQSRVPAQDAVLYRDAIEKAGKVLKLHPNSKWADDALWLIGKSYFALGEFTLADRKFKELVTNHPESKFADDSYYYMGLCQMNLGNNDQALSAFASIENAPKKSPYLENVIYSKAYMAMAADNYSDAIELFERYTKTYPGGDSAAQAMFNIGKCQETLKKYTEAYEAYSSVNSYGPSRNLYFESSLAAAAVALKADSIETGMKILQKLADDQRYFARLGPIKLKIAEGHYLKGEVDKAAQIYDEVITENPRTPFSAEAYYRLGLIQQNDKFDLKAAKEAFSMAQSESPESEYRGLALARSAQIAKLETYQLQLQRADSLKKADELNMLGQSEFPPMPDTVTDPKPPQPDSVIIAPTETESAGNDDTLAVPANESSGIAQVVTDSLNTLSEAPVTEPRLLQTAVSDTIRESVVPDSLIVRQTGGRESGRFASILNADSIDKALEDSALQGQTIVAPPKDTAQVKQAEPKPPAQPIAGAKQDSIRQAIILSGIETRYLLSELLAYELNRPDSAIKEYLLIADEHPESFYAAKSLLAAARIESGKGDSATAREHLNRLIKEHPDTPQAAEAARMLDQPLDMSQNALGLYASAESLAVTAQMADSAITLFHYIEANYPDLAPKAAYASAWVLDEVKGVEDSSAYYAYTDVARKFPQTAYADAANERLGKVQKAPRRRSTPREQPQPEPDLAGKNKPDSSNRADIGLALAPPVKVPGDFIYPEALLSRDLRGKVVFKIRINISGRVEDYQIMGPSGEQAIDSSATAALLRTEFDTSQLDFSQLDQYFQYSIPFKRPDIDQFYDPYLEQRERGGP